MTGSALAVREAVDPGTGAVVSTAPFEMASFLADLKNPAHAAQQKALAAAYDAACSAIIGPNDVQEEGARTFKRKSAWRKLARYFNISTRVVKVEKELLTDGLFLATVTVEASAPWGQSAEAVGACCTDEATGRRVITVADAIATAETRATNRATSNLIAMGEVSAEEMGERSRGEGEQRRPPSAPAGNDGTNGGAGSLPTNSTATSATKGTEPAAQCPKCGGQMWDNRVGKRNPKAPDYKCKDKGCDGVIWPPKDAKPAAAPVASSPAPLHPDEFPDALLDQDDDLPFNHGPAD